MSAPSASRGALRPVRVAEQLAGQEHHVGLAVADDLLGLLRLGDEADRADREAGCLADPGRERHLVARPER